MVGKIFWWKKFKFILLMLKIWLEVIGRWNNLVEKVDFFFSFNAKFKEKCFPKKELPKT